MRPSKLSDEDIRQRLGALEHWSLRDGKLCRQLRFADFSRTFAFMTRVAMAAEKLDHHPDWSNVYNRVSIELHTHDAGGITELDFALAVEIEGFAATQ